MVLIFKYKVSCNLMQHTFKIIVVLTLAIAYCQAQQFGSDLNLINRQVHTQGNVNAGLKQCITESFSSTCKSQLYNCFNTSNCSYQLHTNTQHIFLKNEDTKMAKIYFSNPIAVALHDCLNKQCGIG